jgi:hypothetical protein
MKSINLKVGTIAGVMSLTRRASVVSASLRPSSLLVLAMVLAPDLGLGDSGEVCRQINFNFSALILFSLDSVFVSESSAARPG